MSGFEQGPIRPPSEAGSLLVRVNRNCPWNKCAFCPVYKGAKYSKRSVAEVLSDLDAMRETFGDSHRTVFLQDANPLLIKPDQLIPIVEGIRERFPKVTRITAYARSRTLARRKVEDLIRLREAGLNRLHVGLESGSDQVLDLVEKGVSRADQIEGGIRAKQAGFELSEYVMPGLGGRELTDIHADETASAIAAIGPDFVRLRTTAVIPGTGMAKLRDEGRFSACSEVELVTEIRRFLAGLDGVETRLESDHMLNLLMELRGNLPEKLPELIGICDSFLALEPERQWRFVIARRMGWTGRLQDFDQAQLHSELNRLFAQVEQEGVDLETLAAELRTRMV